MDQQGHESRQAADCAHDVAFKREPGFRIDELGAESQCCLFALASLCAGERDAVQVLRRLLRRVRPTVVPQTR